MLDSEEYRAAESAAKAQLPSWWVAQTHHVDHFEREGFPVRPRCFSEIGQLLDTMQENRFSKFMAEIDGLSTADDALLKNAVRRCIEFQLIHFPRREPILPLSTMIASLVLYKKLVSTEGERIKLLEVGPGCGYLSFFTYQDLKFREYTQIEAAESFYILQNRINNFLYGSSFVEFAHQYVNSDFSFTRRSDFEVAQTIKQDLLRNTRCSHFPWWMLGVIASRQEYYDVVTSNANLNEFRPDALKDYLTVFRKCMKDSGLFMVQCTGFPAHGDLSTLYDQLFNFGFRPLFVAESGLVAKNSEAGRIIFGKKMEKSFMLNNLIMVQEGHPLFSTVNKREYFRNGFSVDHPMLHAIYRLNKEGRHISQDQYAEEIIGELVNDDRTLVNRTKN